MESWRLRSSPLCVQLYFKGGAPLASQIKVTTVPDLTLFPFNSGVAKYLILGNPPTIKRKCMYKQNYLDQIALCIIPDPDISLVFCAITGPSFESSMTLASSSQDCGLGHFASISV